MDDFIAKPIQAHKLLDLLQQKMPERLEAAPSRPACRSVLVEEAQKLAEQVEQMLSSGQTKRAAEVLSELERVHHQLQTSFAA